MGTPIPRAETEIAVKSCTSEVIVRKMTEEEIKKYSATNTLPKQKEINSFIDNSLIRNLERAEKEERLNKEMSKKELKPSKERLIELCKGFSTVYAASKVIAPQIGVSRTTVVRWIAEAGIKLEKENQEETKPVNVESDLPDVNLTNEEPPVPQDAEIETATPGSDEGQSDIQKEIEEVPNGIVPRIATAVYSLGEVEVVIDYRQDKVTFVPQTMTFKEAAAVMQLLNEIL